MAKEILSDEEYLDSLLKKLSQDEEVEELVTVDENTDIEIDDAAIPMPEMFDLEAMMAESGEQEELSDTELEAAADESLNQLLQEGIGEMDFSDDISLQQLIEREQGISLEEEQPEEAEPEEYGLGFDFGEELRAESEKEAELMSGVEPEAEPMTEAEIELHTDVEPETEVPEEIDLGIGFGLDSEDIGAETETEEIDLGINLDIGMEESVDEELGIGLEEALGLGLESESSGDELLDSLSSIVREIHEDTVTVRSDFSGVDELEEKPKKNKTKKEKPEKIKKSKPKKAKKENKFLKKLQDIFFKVEVVDLEEEAELEEKKKQEKEEKKKAKAIEKEQQKKQKQEDKKAADARKREIAQAKKQEKERKRQEKKAKKAEMEAALGPEERVKLKPAFLAFMATVIAVMAIAVVLMSESFSYRNNINAAQRCLAVKNYEEAYRVLAGMELKQEDELLYQKIELLVRLDKQYDAYVNFRNLEMPKEALNALIQGMTIYYANAEQAKTLEIEAEMEELKETLMYSLVNDFGLDEDKVLKISEIADTNEYTKEIEFYSANQIQ